MSVAFLGEPGSYSELAAREYFGKNKKYIAKPEFKYVYNSVMTGESESCIIPIENSLAGSIHQNYDLLIEGDLIISGEIFLKVSHFLLANDSVKKRDIKKIYSHPQPHAQCKNYLQKNFPDAELIACSSTSDAVVKIKKNGSVDSAAIASFQAAIDYKMAVLDKNIEDNHKNQTRFLILSKNPAKISVKTKKDVKTSVVFTLKNIPGALFKALGAFALRDIDLYKIESRPVSGKHFEYMFYLDFAGHTDLDSSQNALNHLKEITSYQRLLGTYFKGDFVSPNFGL